MNDMIYGHALDPGVQPALTMPSECFFKEFLKILISTILMLSVFYYI